LKKEQIKRTEMAEMFAQSGRRIKDDGL